MPVMQPAHPAVVAWDAIRQQLPQLRRLMSMVTPETLVGNALTISTGSPRIYSALTGTQRMSVMDAARRALGDDVTLIDQPTAEGQTLEWGAAGANPGGAPAFVCA